MNKPETPEEAARWARQAPNREEVRNILLWMVSNERKARDQREHQAGDHWQKMQKEVVAHLQQFPDELIQWLIEDMQFGSELIRNRHFPTQQARELMLDSGACIQKTELIDNDQQDQRISWLQAADNLVAWDHYRDCLPESIQEFAIQQCQRDQTIASVPHGASQQIDVAFQVWVHLTSNLQQLDNSYLLQLFNAVGEDPVSRDLMSWHPSINRTFLLTLARRNQQQDRDFLTVAGTQESLIAEPGRLREKLRNLQAPPLHEKLALTSSRTQELIQLFGELVEMEPDRAANLLADLSEWQRQQLQTEDLQKILATGQAQSRVEALREAGRDRKEETD